MFKIILFLGSLLIVSLAHAATTAVVVAKVPQTGASKTIGTRSLAVQAGADGNPAIGKAWPNPRFESYPLSSSESACITDKLTGLMWAKNAFLQEPTKPNWTDALTYAASLTLCGHNDWRLPNKRELMSLMNYGYTGVDRDSTTQINWLKSQGFSNVQEYYWSSSTSFNNTDTAWYVDMNDGGASGAYKSNTGTYLVWPVRSGR